MIYIVLDTNIWIYLANGWNSEKENHHDGAFSQKHFGLLDKFKEKVADKSYQFLVSDLVFKEWDRNKHRAKSLVSFLEEKQKNIIESSKPIKAFLSEKDFLMQRRLIERAKKQINERIEQNKKHIDSVEEFLKNSCVNIPISDKVINMVGRFAMNKEIAPFVTDKKNNFPDAIILYSSVEYLRGRLFGDSRAIFVSNNYTDFADDNNHNEFHQDIADNIENLDLTYERHLNNVIELSEDLQDDIEFFLGLKREIEQETHFYCQSPFCQSNDDYPTSAHLTTKIRIADSTEEFEDPNQLRLFKLQSLEEIDKEKIGVVDSGDCPFCGETHICCPECNSLMIDPDDIGGYYCRDCEILYEVKFSTRNKDKIIVKKSDYLELLFT